MFSVDPVKYVQKGAITGDLPQKPTGTVVSPDLIKAGNVEWNALIKGGIFAFDKKPMVIEAATAGAIIVFQDSPATTAMAMPTVFPFKLPAGMWLKYSAGTEVFVTARFDSQRTV